MADSLSHPETHASECISVYIGAPMGYSFSGQTLLIDSKGTWRCLFVCWFVSANMVTGIIVEAC